MAAVAVAQAPAGSPPSPPAAEPAVYQKAVSSRLNTTGRAISMPIPLKEDGQTVGEIIVRIEPDDSVSIPKAILVEKLGAVVDAPTRQRLEGVAADGAGMVRLTALSAAGFDARFDPGQLELNFVPKAEQRPVGELSLGGRRQRVVSSAMTHPAMFSAYLNVLAGVDYAWGTAGRDDRAAGRVDLEAVFRVYAVVVENEFSWEGDIDGFLCPINAICTYDHNAGLRRRRSRVTYDFHEHQVRVQFGDVDSAGATFQRTPDVLGITIEKSPRKLAPGEHIRPTGHSSFRIDNNAEVEVLINGAPVQKLRLRAGSYNLRDLPLTSGANDVMLLITDDTGQRREIRYTSFFDGALLAAGKSEWSVSGGVPSYLRDNEREYRRDEYFATGFYRRGLTDQVTGEAHVQGDNHVVMGGLGLFSATPWGFLGLQGAMSSSSLGNGFAANFNWAIANYRGAAYAWTGQRETFNFGAEYRSSAFRTPGEYLATASGVLFAEQPYWLRLYASYSMPLTHTISLTLGGRYQFSNPDALVLSPYTVHGDRYGLDLTLSAPVNHWISASLTAGYSNETYLRQLLGASSTSESDGEFRVMARLYFRPSDESRIATSYDSLNRDLAVSGHYGVGRGIDRWETTVDVHQSGRDERASAAAGLAFYGNRGDVRVSHSTGLSGVTLGHLDATPTDQRTSLRAGTALAFADGQFGWGQPVRGNGFAIVAPHASIAGHEVVVGTKEEVRARADGWGAVIVPNLPAYAPTVIPVDVPTAPVGYSLGTGAFDVLAPYRGGYRLEVGSSYSVSAYGTLLKADGEPVALLTGVAHPAENPNKQVAIFTNATGKFGAEGLAPGRWIIAMATEGAPTTYMIEIPPGAQGLFKAGTLKPVGGR